MTEYPLARRPKYGDARPGPVLLEHRPVILADAPVSRGSSGSRRGAAGAVAGGDDAATSWTFACLAKPGGQGAGRFATWPLKSRSWLGVLGRGSMGEQGIRSARPEFGREPRKKAVRLILGLVRLRSHRARFSLESFGAPVVESPDAASGCRRACEGAHPDGVVRTNFAGCRSADFNRKLSRCGLPVMRRARCAG